MDLERLDEALENYDEWIGGASWDLEDFIHHLSAAARAYRDLANGERVEPDYHAGANVLLTHNPDARIGGMTLDDIRQIVDAAIGDKLLVSGGERVEWCEYHEGSQRFGVGEGLFVCPVAEQIEGAGRFCRIVSKLLVDPPVDDSQTEEE